MSSIKVGDEVELVYNCPYWGNAKGIVTKITEKYTIADLVTAPESTLRGQPSGGLLRKDSGFYHHQYRLVDDSASFIPENWS